MAKFRKKPVVIEAWLAWDLLRAAARAWGDLPTPIVEAYDRGDVVFADSPKRIEIRTREGLMTANLTDYVIKGVKGELYPCKPDIFAATYEAVGSGKE